MRKIASMAIVTCMLALVFVSFPTVSAAPSKPKSFNCMIYISFDPFISDPHWEGRISGDMNGGFQLWEKAENYVVGKVEHYFERFVITPDSGGVIEGDDQGVWSFQTFKFRYTGLVTDTSGDWGFLAGYKVHGVGYTTALTSFPLYGVASLTLSPA